MNEIANLFNKMSIAARLVALVAVMAVIGIVYFYTLRLPVREAVAAKQEEIKNLKEKLAENQAIANNRARFKEQVRRLREDLKQAQSLLPSDSDIKGILRQITSLARKSGLDVMVFQPGGEMAQGFYSRIPITLKLKGSYNDVAVFFDKVGKLKRIMNVHDISLTSPQEKDGKVILNVDCTVTTFRFRGAR